MQPSYRPFAPQPPQRSPHATARRGIGPMIGGSHPQQSLTPAQMQAQQEAQRNAIDLAKRRSRKPTDRNIPDGVEECIIGDGVQRYRDLRDVERRLDAAMMRKRLDIQSVRDSTVKRYRTLRVWISNTVDDQIWQADAPLESTFDFIASSDAAYKVKIEGRLLDDEIDDTLSDDSDDDEDDEEADVNAMDEDTKPAKKPTIQEQKSRFSHFFKSMTVEFENTRTKEHGEQKIEWKKPAASNARDLPAGADFDVIEFRRGGDENVNITISLVRDEVPERFVLSPILSEILDTKEATRAEAVTGVWEYIRQMGLQEDDEKRSFRCDDLLRQIFARDTGYIPYVPDAISSHMTPLPPLKLSYTIRCDKAFHDSPQPTIYDIRVVLGDPLAAHLQSFNANPSLPATLREIAGLNDNLALFVQKISESKAKHNFLEKLGREPGVVVQKWMSSQKRDLEVILGEATRGGGEDAQSEEFRRGGKDGIWGTQHVKESVNMILTTRPR